MGYSFELWGYSHVEEWEESEPLHDTPFQATSRTETKGFEQHGSWGADRIDTFFEKLANLQSHAKVWSRFPKHHWGATQESADCALELGKLRRVLCAQESLSAEEKASLFFADDTMEVQWFHTILAAFEKGADDGIVQLNLTI